jgi:hypothetical protein
MQLNKVVQVGIVSFLACILSLSVSGVKASQNSSSNIAPASVASVESSKIIAQGGASTIATGKFLKGEQPTTGTARIISENGQRYLVLGSTFSTSDQGPDLHVLLDTSLKPPATYQGKAVTSYLNLGKLQKFTGEQRYPIPDVVNLSQFKSIVIWCRMANATFGYAPISTKY